MEYGWMRNLLDELRMELVAVFEQGFARGSRHTDSLRELARRLAEWDLARGAQLLEDFCGEMELARVDTAWTSEKAAALYGSLWRYTALCGRRLEYMETRANLIDG